MASSEGSSGGSGGFSLKLFIDGKTNKVIFAEAGKDLVDFFFSLILLPLGTAFSLLSKKAVPCSMGNLVHSIYNLDLSYFSTGAATSTEIKAGLIDPPLICFRLGQCRQLLPWRITAPKLFECLGRHGFVSDVSGVRCHYCNCQMKEAIRLLENRDVRVHIENDEVMEKGFVKELVTYTITDDLCIAPLSTISCVHLIKGLNVNDLGALLERRVNVRTEQAMKILEASLRSETVLSDVFL